MRLVWAAAVMARVGAVLALTGAISALTGGAVAQSACVVLTAPLQCTGRFPAPANRIAIGNVIYCDGVPVAVVQYDIFKLVAGRKRYDCSLDVPCSNTSLPASVRTKFCS